VTVGTVMERSHVPLNKWALASPMMAEKGISAKQLRRELILGSYRTARFMCSRIREAMKRASLMGRRIDGSGKTDVAGHAPRPGALRTSFGFEPLLPRDRSRRLLAVGLASRWYSALRARAGAADLRLRLPPPRRAAPGPAQDFHSPHQHHAWHTTKRHPAKRVPFHNRDTRAARRRRVLSVPLKLANRTRTGRFGSVLEVISAATVWPDSDRFQHSGGWGVRVL
jgi:hypothetical protein